jgi:predicted RNA-binding Zn ribbon-like protein
MPVPRIPVPRLVELVNEYAPQTRAAAGEQDDPYPDLSARPDALGLPRARTRDLVEIAEGLWLIFAAAQLSERTQRLNTLLEGCALAPSLDESGEIKWTSSRRDNRGLLLAACVAELLDAAQRYGWERLGICTATDCADVYIDVTGRGSRRYCSHGCLNRARVRAYRSRQRLRRRYKQT